MSTTTSPSIPVQNARRPFGAKRVVLIVSGSLALLIAAALLAVGGVAAVAAGERDEAGYLSSDTYAFSSTGHALSSENLDLKDVPGWFGDNFATMRVEATSAGPVFIGIGRTIDVERYLAGVPYDRVTDFDTDPFNADYQRVDGTREPVRPASQSFWRVQASGSGTQTISWALEDGDWSAVAMNADGSRTVSVDARFGAKVDALGWITAVALAAGGLVLLIGGGLIYLGARRPRHG
jgi:hypothetical protein